MRRAAGAALLLVLGAVPTVAPQTTDLNSTDQHAGHRHAGRHSHARASRPQRTAASDRICFPKVDAPRAHRQSERRGQIVAGTSFGELLKAIASLPTVNLVLEIGTFYGGGSTVDLANGLQRRWERQAGDAPNCVETAAERCCHSLVITLEVFEQVSCTCPRARSG